MVCNNDDEAVILKIVSDKVDNCREMTNFHKKKKSGTLTSIKDILI